MRIRWRGLELPTRVVNDQAVSTSTYGRFSVEPFERGFGTTVGNSLRRILLSSLEGAAVTSIKVSGVDHEFQPMPGLMEDMTDIILNVKSLVVKLHGEGPKTMKVRSSVKGPVTADMIEADPAIEIINRDLVLATLTDNIDFEMELEVNSGRGYLAAEEMIDASADQEVGRIYVDASFSPVTRVRYNTEDTRVGQKTNYDRLVLEIWTDGTISPEMALVEAAKIFRKHLNPFVQYFDVGEQLPVSTMAEPTVGRVDQEMANLLSKPVSELELTVRANNCLESAKIRTVGDLVQMNESELLKLRSFGKTSLREVKRKLADLGLSLGMGSGGEVSTVDDEDIDLDEEDEADQD